MGLLIKKHNLAHDNRIRPRNSFSRFGFRRKLVSCNIGRAGSDVASLGAKHLPKTRTTKNQISEPLFPFTVGFPLSTPVLSWLLIAPGKPRKACLARPFSPCKISPSTGGVK